MNKYILTIAIVLTSVIGFAQDKEEDIKKGNSYVNISFDASDTINESETYWINITAPQDYTSMQDVYVDIDTASGNSDMYISLYGRLTSSSSWTAVGDSVNWGGSGSDDTTFTMSFTAPNRYRYYKVQFRSNSTDQQSLISDVQFKQWYSGGSVSGSSITDGTATLTGGVLSGVTSIESPLYDVTGAAGITFGSADATKFTFSGISEDLVLTPSSNTWTLSTTTGATAIAVGGLNLTGVGTIGSGKLSSTAGVDLGTSQSLTGTTALTIGAGTETVAINSSDWDIGATGIMTGMGASTFDGVITATGGVVYPTVSTHIWTAGGSVVLATAGTDAACTNGDRYWTEIMIPYNVTLTGVSYLVGSVGGTDSVVVQLVNSSGTEVATSRPVGEAADIVGTTAQFQSVDFSTTYAATAGVYYIVLQFNGTTAKFRTYPITGSPFVAGSVGGTWQTAAGITPGTTFTADKGAICITY